VRHSSILLLAALPSVASAGKLSPCHLPGLDEEARCGRYEVFEDRVAGKGRKLSLNVVVLPARGPDVAPDPLVFLAGGGVAPATRYAGFLAGAFPSLRAHRDILLVDQRGTGGSNPLDCELSRDDTNPDYRDDARWVKAVRRCRQSLEPKADLRLYTTPIAMDDLDEVRAWLGYARLNLYGVSYGTRAAMVYVRQHAERVRAVALQGVIPVDAPVWLEGPRSAQASLDLVFQAAHAAFPELEKEFAALLARLVEKPVAGIDDRMLRDFAWRSLFGADRIHDLPLLIHRAHAGDFAPLAARITPKGPSGIPNGIYLSLVCSEDIPRFDPAALPSAAAGTFWGAFRIARDVSACREWPAGRLPPGFEKPISSTVPALLMNGALDHITPPRYGLRVARTLANAYHLVLPGRGHNDVDPCVTGIVESFFAAADASKLDTSCLARTPELTFALEPGQLR
jgi:pimeloyl-ACP methyl ester carboxylesterase